MLLEQNMTVADAKTALAATGEDAAIVMYGSTPLGVITMATLRGRQGRVPCSEALLTDVMDLEIVHIEPDADLEQTLHAYREAAWKSSTRRHPCADETVSRRQTVFESTAVR